MKRYSMAVACALLVSTFAQAEPPPFGTELQQWSLQMSGSYAGSGMTWIRDSGKFFLMDQGHAGPCRVWKLDPADPQGTIESVPWTFADLGDSTVDIPWSIAWDNDSGCFWMSQIPDGSIYAGCYLLRHVWNGSSWVWGGTSSDSWYISDTTGGPRLQWVAGMEKHPVEGVFYAIVYESEQDTSGLGRFDPYTKSVLGLLANGVGIRERGLTLVPWDSFYVLTTGYAVNHYRKRDSTGLLLQSAGATHGPTDWALHVPSVIRAEDTVCAYCINSNSSNYFERVSVGMLWGQLGAVGVEEGEPAAQRRQPEATVARGVLTYQPTASSLQQAAELIDINGRLVMELQPGQTDIRHLAPGVYFIEEDSRVPGSMGSSARKVVIQH